MAAVRERRFAFVSFGFFADEVAVKPLVGGLLVSPGEERLNQLGETAGEKVTVCSFLLLPLLVRSMPRVWPEARLIGVRGPCRGS